MKTGVLILLILSVAAGQGMVWLELRQKKERAYFVKTAASILFVCAGVLTICSAVVSAGEALILLGLVLGKLGDIFLSGPSISREECAKPLFFAGGIFFGLGHLAYFAALMIQAPSFCAVSVIAALLAAGLTLLSMRSGFWKVTASDKISYMIYGAVSGILLMGAVNWTLAGGSRTAWILLAAAGLFVLSDWLLATANFSRFRSVSGLRYLCIFLYYLAQAAFVWGLGSLTGC